MTSENQVILFYFPCWLWGAGIVMTCRQAGIWETYCRLIEVRCRTTVITLFKENENKFLVRAVIRDMGSTN